MADECHVCADRGEVTHGRIRCDKCWQKVCKMHSVRIGGVAPAGQDVCVDCNYMVHRAVQAK